MLKCIFSTYPHLRLKREGLGKEKVHTFPWFHAPLMAKSKYGIRIPWLDEGLESLNRTAFPAYVAHKLPECNVFIALSGTGYKAGPLAQRRGAKYICDRGSSHIRYQDNILREEFARWGQEFPGINSKAMAHEETEYAAADIITVPSEFARESFIHEGIPSYKVRKIPYGADLTTFSKTSDPPQYEFNVLFVGQVSFQKGVPYLLQAFSNFKNRRKKLTIIGALQPEVRKLMIGKHFDHINFIGVKPHAELKHYMRVSHVMVLPSIQEGLALVQGEAMACGCPLVSTANT